MGLCASFESVWLFPSIPWLPCLRFFQLVCSRVLSTPPMAAQPGDNRDCHLPMGTGHSQLSTANKLLPCSLLPGSGSTEPTWPHKRNPVFSSKICHLEKEILKLRVMVMSNLKKEEKWKWEESVCCSLNLSAQRMHRGPGWVLKYYFKMLPSDSGNSSSCSLWVSTVPPGLERAAGTGACWWTCHVFLWKKHRKPQSLGLQCCEETSPTWLAGLYPKKQMTLEQNLIFCFELSIF